MQTIGRAARNIEGRVILYGDVMTDSMKAAIDETYRRRKIQNEYNIEHNIDPKSVIREIGEDMLSLDYGVSEETLNIKENKKEFSSKKDIEKEIKILEKEIQKLSKELDFEGAIVKRDEMLKLKKLLLEF